MFSSQPVFSSFVAYFFKNGLKKVVDRATPQSRLPLFTLSSLRSLPLSSTTPLGDIGQRQAKKKGVFARVCFSCQSAIMLLLPNVKQYY